MKIASLLLVFLLVPIVALEQPDKMDSITKWQDVAPFAGKVIAYKISGGSMGSEKEYVLTDDATLKFGFIYWRSTEWGGFDQRGQGYEIQRLLKLGGVHSAYGLPDFELKKMHPFLMRCATSHEIETICKVIDSNSAEFQYTRNEDFYSFLEKSQSNSNK